MEWCSLHTLVLLSGSAFGLTYKNIIPKLKKNMLLLNECPLDLAKAIKLSTWLPSFNKV